MRKEKRKGGMAHGRVWLNLFLCCHGRDALSALCKEHGYTGRRGEGGRREGERGREEGGREGGREGKGGQEGGWEEERGREKEELEVKEEERGAGGWKRRKGCKEVLVYGSQSASATKLTVSRAWKAKYIHR